MFFMWLTSKAQFFFILILMGLYSWNSFGANLVIQGNSKSSSYSHAQIQLLSERLQKIEGDEFQTSLGSALIEFAAMIKEQDIKLNLDSLLVKAGNTPLPFASKYYKLL